MRAENEAGRSLWSPLGEGRTAAVPPALCFAPSLLGSSQTSLTVRWEVRVARAFQKLYMLAHCTRSQHLLRMVETSPVTHCSTAAARPPACPPACLTACQGPEDDGGSPVLFYQVERRPKCAAACRDVPDEWVVAYQVSERALPLTLCADLLARRRCGTQCVEDSNE